MMKRLAMMIFLVMACAVVHAVTDVYALKIRLRVPHVVNNSESTGKRKYKTHVLVGTMEVEYATEGQPTVRIVALTNRTFKVGGVRVFYDTWIVSSRWNLIGSNRTGVFRTPSVCIEADALPSYVASYQPTDDNSLVITMSGAGASAKRISGRVAGTIGCGCSYYGHVSPTRIAGACGPLSIVDDVASVFGTWSATRKARRN